MAKKQTIQPVKFIVKKESFSEFFDTEKQTPGSCMGNDYYKMKDTIFVSAQKIPDFCEIVVFILEDAAQGSKTKLENVYTYNVCKYDSMTYELKLINFEVKLLAIQN